MIDDEGAMRRSNRPQSLDFRQKFAFDVEDLHQRLQAPHTRYRLLNHPLWQLEGIQEDEAMEGARIDVIQLRWIRRAWER